jgi:hypothetical protein
MKDISLQLNQVRFGYKIRNMRVGFLNFENNSTKEKLAEAKYFLNQMNENQNNSQVFRFNLDAFLVSARSVTMIMQKEFNKNPTFKQWYADKQCVMKADKTMQYLNKLRTITIHQGTVPFDRDIHIEVALVPIGSKQRGSSNVKWYFNDFPYPHEDIFKMCQGYLDKLAHLVDECVSKFA